MSAITLTSDTPEPQDESTFFLTDPYDNESTVSLSCEEGWVYPGETGCHDWSEVRDEFLGWKIQSLADHDAEVRARVLDGLKPDAGKWFPEEGAVVVHGKMYFEADYVLTRRDIQRIRAEALELTGNEASVAVEAIARWIESDEEPMDEGVPIEAAYASFAAVAKSREAGR